MKKLLLTFLVVTLSISTTFAADECAIYSDMAPVLKEYTENVRKVSKAITTLAREEKAKQEGFDIYSVPGIGDAHSFILSAYSNIFNFESYYSYFKYLAVFPISNKVPYQVKRDYRILDNDAEGLNRYLRTISKNGLFGIEINDICSKASILDCDLPNSDTTAGGLITMLMKNHDGVMNMYRNIVIGETTQYTEAYLLVPSDFETQLKEYYSKEAYGLCSNEELGFFDSLEKVGDSFKKITDFQNTYKDGVQKWKDAWALLMGQDTSTQKYADVERRLLMNELSKNGIQGDSQGNMLASLDKFNQEGFSLNSNFAYNTFNNTWNKLTEGLRQLKNNTIGDFFEKPEQQAKEEIDIEEVLKAQDNSITINELKEKVNKMYLELSSQSAPSESNVTNLISRIIKTHIDILDSIEILSTQACQNAVDVCLKQDPSKGDCGKCN